MTRRWEEKIGNTVYEYVEMPTAVGHWRRPTTMMRRRPICSGPLATIFLPALTTLANDAASHHFVAVLWPSLRRTIEAAASRHGKRR